MASKFALLVLIVVLAAVNGSIVGKERHLAEGKIVYLELVSVEPHYFRQSDHMPLYFVVAKEIQNLLPNTNGSRHSNRSMDGSDGYAVVRLDERGVGSFVRIHANESLSDGEILMRYRVRMGRVKLATNAFFFQEGHGHLYQSVRYGQFRVNDESELLLAAMFDKDLNKLGPADSP